MTKQFKIISVSLFIVIVSAGIIYLLPGNNIFVKTPSEGILSSEQIKYYKALDSLVKYNPDQAKIEIQSLDPQMKTNPDSPQWAYVYYYKSLLNHKERYQAKDSILDFLGKALAYTQKYGNKNLESNINYEYGRYYEKNYNYVLSLEHFLKAQSYYEEQNREDALVKVYGYLGVLYRILDKPEKSLLFHQKAEEILKKLNVPVGIAINKANMGNTFINLGENKEARENLLASLHTFEFERDTLNMMKILISLSNAEQNMGNIKESLEYLDRAYNLAVTAEDTYTQGHALIHYGSVYYELNGDNQKALQSFLEGYKLTGQPNPDVSTLKTVADIFFKDEKYKDAYNYLDQYYKIKDSTTGKDVMSKVEVLQFESKLKQQQYEAKIKEERYQKQFYIYLIIMGATSFTAVFIWFLYRYKNKSLQLSRLENKKMEEKVQAEKEIQRLQIEKYEQELESKNKLQLLEKQQHEFEQRANKELRRLQSKQYNLELEAKNRKLTAINLQLLSRNQLLNEIEEMMIHERGNEGRTLYYLKKIIKTYRNQEKDWELFKETFAKVYPDFLKNLDLQYPDLTKTEMRVCMYIMMRMNNSEMSELLNITHQSLISIRYHIRKKMNLDRTKDLDKAIQAI